MKSRILFILSTLFVLGSVRLHAQPNTIVLKNGFGSRLGLYATLQAAYDAIPVPLTDAYQIEITTAYTGTAEVYPIVLREQAGANKVNHVTIIRGGNSGATIAGSVINSEMLILDGADWITFNGHSSGPFSHQLYFSGQAEDSAANYVHANYPAVALRNGASHNTFYYCDLSNGSNGFSLHDAPALRIEGTNNARGNDSNIISNCLFHYSDSLFSCFGNPAIPNKGNRIDSSKFEEFVDNAIYAGTGNTGFAVSFNGFKLTFGRSGGTLSSPRTGMILDGITDTTRVVNNFFDFPLSGDSSVVALTLSNTAGVNGYTLIANNAFRLTKSYFFDNNSGAGLSDYFPDYSLRYTGIEINGAGLIYAGIFHNTLRFTRNYDATSPNKGYSYGLLYSATNPGNQIDVVNNLWLNSRKNGPSGSAHLSMKLNTAAGIYPDYNTYQSGASISVGNTVYPSYAAYQQANTHMDVHSNDSLVLFDGLSASTLSATMYGQSYMQGTLLPEVTTDVVGFLRSFPYRGNYEIAPNCGVGPNLAKIGISDPVCMGSHIYGRYNPVNGVNGLIHQWQKEDGSGVFQDIPGQTATELFGLQTGEARYRVKDSCVGNGSVSYTNIDTASVRGSGYVGVLTETHVDGNYVFTLTGSTTAENSWNFGDGTFSDSSTDTVRSYTYTTPGTYQVSVQSQWGCAPGDTFITIHVFATGITQIKGAEAGISTYPNPANNFIQLNASKGNLKEITLTDLAGRLILNKQAKGGVETLDVSNIPAGYYLMRVVTHEQAVNLPLTIAH